MLYPHSPQNETVKRPSREQRRKMAKDKKDMESVTDYVEEKALDQEKTNAAMAKMRISEKKSGDEDRYVQHSYRKKRNENAHQTSQPCTD